MNSKRKEAGGGETGVAGAGIEAGASCSWEDACKLSGETSGGWGGYLLPSRADGRSKNSREVGGRRGCGCPRRGVGRPGQQQEWRLVAERQEGLAKAWRSQAGWRQQQ